MVTSDGSEQFLVPLKGDFSWRLGSVIRANVKRNVVAVHGTKTIISCMVAPCCETERVGAMTRCVEMVVSLRT